MLKNQKATATNSGPAGTTTTAEHRDRSASDDHGGMHAAAETAHPAIDRMASSAHRAVNSADGAAKQATDTMARAGTKAGAKGKEIYLAGTGYLREHPVLTIGVAVATGYLLSRLLTTRQA